MNDYTFHVSEFICKDDEGYRLKKEENEAFRSMFAIDRDRILYSGAYRRYNGKTQVFSFSNLMDEEVTNRSLHTTYVSQIARTITKNLGLNLELTEAIALGHDLGHPPFGHDGEKALSNICVANNIGEFHHNLQSLQIVDHISRKGEGLNLTFQVRDGIISHDGEIHETKIEPNKDKNNDDIENYIRDKKQGKKTAIQPATLEGCVVRVSDTIAYIGADIEDAIRFGVINRDSIPHECSSHLGNNNSDIIEKLVTSVVKNSIGCNYISMDEKTSDILRKLKEFNYQKIYDTERVINIRKRIALAMNILFEKYVNDIKENKRESRVFTHFLNHKNDDYLNTFSLQEKVRDFIATMTDRYFNEELKDYIMLWK
jgi:dGTPase